MVRKISPDYRNLDVKFSYSLIKKKIVFLCYKRASSTFLSGWDGSDYSEIENIYILKCHLPFR